MHIPECSGIFTKPGQFRTLEYSEPEVYLQPRYIQKPGIFINLVYSELWHIENPGILNTQVYSEP